MFMVPLKNLARKELSQYHPTDAPGSPGSVLYSKTRAWGMDKESHPLFAALGNYSSIP